MTVTRGAARRALRELLGEPDEARTFTDVELDRWIAEGCKDIAKQCEVLQTTATIAISSSTQQYDAPTDMIRCTRADFVADSDTRTRVLDYRDFHNTEAVSWTNGTEGMPALYTMWGVPGSVRIILYPTPAYDGELSLYYYRLPTPATSDADELDIPNGWENCVYRYAEAMALRRDRDPRWQEALQLYTDDLGALYDLTRRHSDQAGEVFGNSYDSWLPSWLVGEA